jgi:hypothetical protein
VSFRNSWWPRRREITKDWKQVQQQRSRCGNKRREEYGKSDIRRKGKKRNLPGRNRVEEGGGEEKESRKEGMRRRLRRGEVSVMY